jgi:hypothetical protein
VANFFCCKKKIKKKKKNKEVEISKLPLNENKSRRKEVILAKIGNYI